MTNDKYSKGFVLGNQDHSLSLGVLPLVIWPVAIKLFHFLLDWKFFAHSAELTCQMSFQTTIVQIFMSSICGRHSTLPEMCFHYWISLVMPWLQILFCWFFGTYSQAKMLSLLPLHRVISAVVCLTDTASLGMCVGQALNVEWVYFNILHTIWGASSVTIDTKVWHVCFLWHVN